MTPIPFPLPAGRILPPTTAYATGLICELRPDLADGVRAAVLGDAAVDDLEAMAVTHLVRGDEQAMRALSRLGEIVHYGGNDPKSLHGLADTLEMIPGSGPSMPIVSPDGAERVAHPTICDVVLFFGYGHTVVGLGDERLMHDWHAAADLLNAYLREGWGVAWGSATLPGEREALRRLIPIHAHTVSLDPDTRAAWAKAHLDALTPPIRPQSPDQLN